MTFPRSPKSPLVRRRGLAQLCVLGVTATLVVLAPTPAWSVESAMRTDTSTPSLRSVPVEAAPPLAPLDQMVDDGLTPAPESVVPPETTTTTASGAPDPGTGDPGTGDPGTDRLLGGEEGVDEFVLIGVGYRSASAAPAQLRVRTDGAWGAWTRIILSADHQPDASTAEAERTGDAEGNGAPVSDPIWIDHADAYQLDLPADATDAEVFLVRETDRRIRITDATDQADAASGQPTIHTRSSWGARPYRGTPDVSPPLRRAIVHHTVSSNSYSQGQVPGMIRSVQAYHQDARGWSDIGYNFVIDRFGGIWEGRAGGIRKPVIGAHALNNNTGSVGVSFLGEATSSVPAASVNAYGQLIGWKMFISGLRPTTANIIGHRDVGQTSCPGSALYNNLGRIRSLALSQYNSLVGHGDFVSRSAAVSGTYTPLSGDFNGDAYGDVLWYGVGGDPDKLWLGSPTGFTGRSAVVGGTYEPTVGDFNGDGRSDVFWYGPGADHDLVWFGRTDGSFSAKSFTIGGDYQPLSGDFNGDGKDDVFWYGAGALKDYLWFGTGSETFLGKATTVNGTFEPFVGDFNGDQRHDLFWYGPGAAADVVWYGEANRGFSGRSMSIGGTYVPLVADVTGGGTDDILWYGPGSAADVLYLGTTNRSFAGRPLTVNGVYDAPFTGDWNADGRGDVFWYRPAGTDILWLATG